MAGNVRVFFKYTLLFCFFLTLSGCDSPMPREVLRVPSPDKVVDVVLATVDTGATSATATLLYIVPAGAKITKESQIMFGDKMENLELVGLSPKMLSVSFSSGRIFSFTNFWHSRNVKNFQYVVKIYLREGR